MTKTKKILNVLLLIVFIITFMAPLTGMMVHKLASAAFLLLCVIHTVVYHKKMNWQRYAVLGLVFTAFLSGIFGMIYREVPWMSAAHKVISIGCVFFLAIHLFVYHRRMMHCGQRQERRTAKQNSSGSGITE